MIDLIDREKVIEAIDDISVEVDEGYGFQYEKWRKYFCELPSVPRKGKWIYAGIRGRFPTCSCSVCGSKENADWAIMQGANFCPNCGSDMRGDKDE